MFSLIIVVLRSLILTSFALILSKKNININRQIRFDQFVNVRSNVIEINFAKKSYINHNAIVHKNFDVFVLLYVKDIVTILNIMLTRKKDELLITLYKVFFHFFLMRMKLE